MPEQFLDDPEVRPAAEQVGGERMPQGMRADFPPDGGFPDIFRDQTFHRPGGDPFAPVIQENGGLVKIPFPEVRARFEIGGQAGGRGPAERYDSLLLALAPDADEPFVQSDVGHVKADELTDPDAGGIKQLEDRPVPRSESFVLVGKVQKLSDLPFREKAGDGAVELRPGHNAGRIVVADPALETILKKRTDGGQLANNRRFGEAPVMQLGQPAAQNDVVNLRQPDFSAVHISG